jgi:hypothetical protein
MDRHPTIACGQFATEPTSAFISRECKVTFLSTLQLSCAKTTTLIIASCFECRRPDVHVGDQLRNPTFRVAALGTLVWSNVTYNINLSLVGDYNFEVDSSGSSLLDDYTATGTVSAPGYGLIINERRRFELISTTTDSATSEQTWNNNTLTIGSDVYKWVSAQKQKSFRNGNPSSVDTYWQASGGVLKNGAPFGLYKFDTSSAGLGYVRFTLVLPNEVIELESWRL